MTLFGHFASLCCCPAHLIADALVLREKGSYLRSSFPARGCDWEALDIGLYASVVSKMGMKYSFYDLVVLSLRALVFELVVDDVIV